MSTPTAPSVTALCLLKPFSIVGASAKAEMTAESTTARMNASVSSEICFVSPKRSNETILPSYSVP